MEIDPVIANPNVARNASSPSHHEQISLEESHAGVRAMIHACAEGNRSVVERFLTQRGPTTPSTNDDSNGDNEATFYYAAKQDVTTGQSPLMAAAHGGHLEICQLLLDHGAPWNAIDRNGQCAGNYAVTARQWPIVNLLVEWGTKAELILSAATRWQRKQLQQEVQTEHLITTQTSRSVEQEPCTKPDYLRQKLHYQGKNDSALVDQDGDAVMMEWERPLMELHAAQLMEAGRRTVLNVGFGLGLIDTALQTYQPALHVIIEAHPQVYQRMLDEQWDQKPGVRIEFGTWQEVLPRLIQQGLQVDAVFFDTYGEHFLDLEDFHNLLPHILSKPHGMYSFFNGLAPDNIFFHGVACNCVKLQLEQLGFQTEFWNCEMQGVIHPSVWEGIRRKYWHDDRDTYYLPVVTWNSTISPPTTTHSSGNESSAKTTDLESHTMTELSSRKTKASTQEPMNDDDGSSAAHQSINNDHICNNKRLRM